MPFVKLLLCDVQDVLDWRGSEIYIHIVVHRRQVIQSVVGFFGIVPD